MSDFNSEGIGLEAWNPKEALKTLAAESTLDGGDMAKVTERLLIENGPAAVASIVHLAQHAPSDTVRLRAATYITDRVLGRITENGIVDQDKDPFAAFVADCVREFEHVVEGEDGEG